MFWFVIILLIVSFFVAVYGYMNKEIHFAHIEYINKPLSEVFAYGTDPTNFTEWMTGISDYTQISGDGFHKGDTAELQMANANKKVNTKLIVLEYIPDYKLVVELDNLSFKHEVRYQYYASAKRTTKFVCINIMRPKGLVNAALLAAFKKKWLQQTKQDMNKIKKVVEAFPVVREQVNADKAKGEKNS